ncbi:conserved hypothetical protein [Histoplasma capsulatum H143]|uniref:HNH nuclease domain-containing protein n=1 Tax=Ajellomyces capsulatus (strain H143) TaxID=544712 RepID=C6HH53_AJECH|nr:conserved hypothetical protein [Histoplasma capsulatum H143]
MFSLTASSSPSDALSEAPSDLSTFVQSKVEFKTRLERYTPLNPNDDTVHFLEIFFKFLPEDGKYHLSEGVVGCTTDASLRQLVSSLDTGLLRPIKAHGGKTPAITPSPRFGVEDSIEELNSMDFEPISRNEQRRLRNKCLSRDGQMCVISKAHNEDAHPPPDSLFAPLETAHIIPFSLASFSGEEERLRTSTIWTNIYRYFPSLRSRMNFTLDNVNEVENAMMLIPSLHTEFGRFHFALEATTTIHRYRVKTFKNFTTINNHFLPTNRIEEANWLKESRGSWAILQVFLRKTEAPTLGIFFLAVYSTCITSSPGPDTYQLALAKNRQWASKTAEKYPSLFPSLHQSSAQISFGLAAPIRAAQEQGLKIHGAPYYIMLVAVG